ncbi:MAG: OmpA family protein [Pseudomonadota bacterium]
MIGLTFSLFAAFGNGAWADTPTLGGGPPAESFIGEQFCFSADVSNANSGQAGYSPYFRVILTDDLSLASADFLGNALTVVNEGVFAAAPGNTLVDSQSDLDVIGPEGATLYTVAYPIGSLTGGAPDLDLEFCVDVDNAAVENVLQPDAISLTPAFALGDSPIGANGPIIGAQSSFDFTPRIITYSLTDMTAEGERPPGPAWTFPIEACANIASDRSVAPIDFSTISPITLPPNIQFVGPVTFTGTGVSCSAVTTPADLTSAPGGVVDLDCASGQGVIGDDAEICATFPVHITDTLDVTSCSQDSAINAAKHLAIQKSGSGAANPGGTRNYSLNLQVSEFVPGVSRIEVTDVLGDGLTFNDDAVATIGATSIPLTGALRTIANDAPGTGQTTIVFFVTDALGVIPAAANVTVSYSADIDQTFTSTGGAVLARDTLVNDVTATFDISGAGNATNCSDSSRSTFAIQDISILKTLVSPAGGVVEPGDAVTFRLRLEVPSGDTNGIVFDDFFPLPVFDATTINTNTNLGSNPDISLGPGDTLGLTPISITASAGDNALRIGWPDINTVTAQVLEVDVTATVSNAPFADNLTLSNLFQTETDNTPSDAILDLDLTPITVRAPALELTKVITGASTGYEPGDSVSYTLTATNTSTAEAFDVVVQDDEPAGLTGCTLDGVSGGSGAGGDSPFDGDGFAFVSFDAPTAGALDGGASVSLTVSCTVDSSVTPGQDITNTASVVWASESGATPFAPVTEQATATTATQPQPVKAIEATSESATPEDTPRPLAQGEVARFRMSVAFPEGSQTNVRLIDLIPAGLQFINDGSATIAFVSTSASAIAATGFDQADCVSGTLEQTGALAGIDPSCVLPAFAGPFNGGTNVTLNIGDVTNTETDADEEFILLELNVLALGNQSNGTTNSNRFRLQSNEVQVTSANVPVRHVLPEIDVTKTSSPSTVDAGDTITYTVRFEHTAGSLADAFDLSFADVLDGTNLENFSFVSGPVAPAGETCTPTGAVVNSADPFGAGVSFTAASLPLGDVCEISYTVTAQLGVVPGTNVQNTATINYDTLTGSGDPGNTTGSTQGGQGALSADDTADVMVSATVNDKRIDSTSFSHTVESGDGVTDGNAREVSVGEIIRYRLEVQLPEGNAPAFTITDQMPDGLQYQAGSARLGLLADGAGIVPTPAIACSNGGTLATTGSEADLPATEPDCQIAASGGPFVPGTDPVFALGALMNDDSDSNLEFVIVEFDALVVNALSNQQGASLDNTYDLAINGGSIGMTTTAFASVVEPQLACTVSGAPDPVDNRTDTTPSVTYTYTVTNNGGATAFQAGATDGSGLVIGLPTGVENINSLAVTPTGDVFLNGTSSLVGNGDFAIGGADNNVLTASGGLQFAPGATLQVTFAASLQAGVQPGGTLVSACDIAYRGQAAGDASTGVRDASQQPTGTGNDPITSTSALNDYRATASFTLTTLPESPEIGAAKAITVGPSNDGDGNYALSYSIVVENSGDVDLENVSLIDTLSTTFAGATFVVDSVAVSSDSGTLVANPGFTGISPADDLLDAGASSLPVGEQGVVTLALTVTPGNNLGPYANSAVASGDSARTTTSVSDTSDDGATPDGDGNGDPTNDSDTTDVTFVEAPVLGLAKQLVGSPVNNADGTYSIQYQFLVENTGDVTLANVQVTDDLAATFAGALAFNVDAVSSSDFTVNVPGFSGSAPDTNLLAGTDSLAAGASGTLLLDVTVEPGVGLGPYANTASVAGTTPSGASVIDTSNNSAASDGNGNGDPGDDSEPTPVSFVEGPRIGAAKTTAGAPVNNGDGSYTLTYNFVVENAGDILLNDVALVEPLQTVFASADAFSVDALSSADFVVNLPGFDGTPGSDNLLAAGNSLAVGEQGAVSLTVTVTPGTVLGPYSNSVTASGTSPANDVVTDVSDDGSDPDGDNDSDPNNDSDPTVTTFTENAVIGAAKAISGGPTNNGDGSYALSYTIIAENFGDVALDDVQLDEPLATTFAGATFTIDSVASSDFALAPGFDGDANPGLLAPGNQLAVGQSGELVIALTITPGANLGPYNNSATASGTSPAGATPTDASDDGSDPDPDGNADPTDDNDPTSVTFAENPQLGLAKSVSAGPLNNGDGSYSLTYTFVVENSGDVLIDDLQIVEPLTTTFAGAGFQVDSVSSSEFAVNAAGFDGNADTALLLPGQTLAVGTSGTVVLAVTITPASNLGPYNNTATVSGGSPGGATLSDDSTDGSDPDPDGNGDPSDDALPTPVAFDEEPAIAVAKSATVATPNFDNTFTSTMTVIVRNAGDVVLNDVQLLEPLATNFAPATVTAVDNLIATGDVTGARPAFDGVGEVRLLADGQSLAVGGSATLTFDVTFDLSSGTQCVATPLGNSVAGEAASPAGTVVSDVSQSGANPDPDSDGDAGNNSEVTDVTIVAGIDGVLTIAEEILPGEALAVSVDDADQNRDAGSVESVTVEVRNTTTGESETVVLTETGVATGIFEGSLTTREGTTGANDDGELIVAFDDGFSVTYTDTLSAAGCLQDIAETGRILGLATLSGSVWLDANSDDVFDPGEQGLEGWVIEVRDGAGTLVATVAVAADGSYNVPDLLPGAGYSITLLHPDTGTTFGTLTNIDLPPDGAVVDQNLPVDPSGVVYDAVTRDAVPGVTVRLLDSSGDPLPAACLLPGQQDQLTADDGFYRFDVLYGADPACSSGDTFLLQFDVPGAYQDGFSELIPPLAEPIDPTGLGDPVRVGATGSAPTGAQPTDYYTAFTLAENDPSVIFNHIPLDPVGVETSSVRLTKRVSRPTTTVGSLLAYTITVENLSPVTLPAIDVQDTLPPGFSYVDDSALLDGERDGFSVSGPRPLVFADISLAPGQLRTIRYLLRVGAGVTQGDYVNTAAPTLNGREIGNSDQAEVQVIADPDFEQTTIIGKVWHDRDGDGWQDSADATGLVLSGGPFGERRALADLAGRASEGDNLDFHQIVLTAPYSEDPLTLTTVEGTKVVLARDGTLTNAHTGDVARGRNAQDLIVLREPVMTGPSETINTITRTSTVTLDKVVEPVRFESGKAAIPDEYVGILRAVLEDLANEQNVRLAFIGHTDNQRLSARTAAIYTDNQGLSESRAQTVAAFLQEALGLPASAIEASGRGDTQPVASNATPDGMALNRRVEILVVYDREERETLQTTADVAPQPTGQMRVTVINRGVSEEGIAGVRLATVEGLVIESDQAGRYHIAGVDGGFLERGRNFIVKVDPATLPRGTQFTTENPRVKRITQGLLNQFDFGVQMPRYKATAPALRTFEFSPGFFEPNSADIRPQFRHLLDQLQAALTAAGGGRVVVLAADTPDARALSVQRGARLREWLRVRLDGDVWANTEVHVMASTAQPSAQRNHWLERAAGVLLAVFINTAHADDACTIQRCDDGGAPVVRSVDSATGEAPTDAPLPHAADGRFRIGLPGGGVIWATEDAAALQPRLAVAGPQSLPVGSGSVANFIAYTNYGAFIEDARLLVFREDDVDRVRPLATLAPKNQPEAFSDFVYFRWPVSAGTVRAGERLAYVLQARDAAGRLDETAAGFVQALSPTAYDDIQAKAAASFDEHRAQTGTAPTQLDEPLGLPEHEAHRMLLRTYGRSQLVRQNILLHGARVRLQGHDISEDMSVYLNGHWLPTDIDGKFAAEYLLPVGKHWAYVAVGSEQDGVWLKDIPVEVTGEHRFLVALADFTAASNSLSGSLEPLSGNDRYAEDTLLEGRLAFYLKAKIKGKYLITSQLDSREEQLDDLLGALDEKDTRSLFRRLDPDRYYPVYGDDSTTVADTDSLGRLYVRLDWDKSRVLWGNYQTQIDGNEFIQYRRTLYGAELDWRSVATTARDETRSRLNVFASETQTALGHSEFLGTGGSLYYLRHLDIIPGSDQARIEVRDATTNRVVESIALARGRDYEIDELQGRIILGKPLLQIAQQSAPSIIREGPLDGNLAILIVDYEYLPSGFDANQLAAGARARHWFGDHLAVGGTYLSEGRGGEDYTLAGLDVTLAAGQGTYLKFEAASSEATQTERLFSSDGGLSFTALNPVAAQDRAGDAYGVESRVNLQELGWTQGVTTLAAWWRRTDDQFSIARRDDGVDIYETGLEMISELGATRTLSLRASQVERELQFEEDDVSVQLDQRLGDNGVLSGEVRWLSQQQLQATTEKVDATLAALRYAHQMNARTEVYAAGQATVNNDGGQYDNNDLVTLGMTYDITSRTALTAEASTGHRGDGATLTLEHDLNADHTVYSTLTHSTDRSDSPFAGGPGDASSGFGRDRLLPGNTLALGHRSRISNQLDVFNEMTLADVRGPVSLGHVFGLNWNVAGGFTLGTTVQRSDVNGDAGVVERTAFTLSGGYRSANINWVSRIEYRNDNAIDLATDVQQWASINRFDWKLNDDYRLLTRLNYADTENTGDFRDDAKLVEGGVGIAYRPVDGNALNWLAKYTYLYDLTSSGQVDQFNQNNTLTDQRSHIGSVEGIKRFGPRWSVGAKLARRVSELRLDRSTGDWFDSTTDFAAIRARYHVIKNWDALAEYRWLRVDEAQSERSGWLVGVDRHVGDNFKIGIGYNFTDFSDDLTELDYEFDGFFLNVLGKY